MNETNINPSDPRLIAFNRLLNIMDDLRVKCPWDQKQTMETLRHLTIEETYELSDAILKGDKNEIRINNVNNINIFKQIIKKQELDFIAIK